MSLQVNCVGVIVQLTSPPPKKKKSEETLVLVILWNNLSIIFQFVTTSAATEPI